MDTIYYLYTVSQSQITSEFGSKYGDSPQYWTSQSSANVLIVPNNDNPCIALQRDIPVETQYLCANQTEIEFDVQVIENIGDATLTLLNYTNVLP